MLNFFLNRNSRTCAGFILGRPTESPTPTDFSKSASLPPTPFWLSLRNPFKIQLCLCNLKRAGIMSVKNIYKCINTTIGNARMRRNTHMCQWFSYARKRLNGLTTIRTMNMRVAGTCCCRERAEEQPLKGEEQPVKEPSV